jgi:hypothetical protein
MLPPSLQEDFCCPRIKGGDSVRSVSFPGVERCEAKMSVTCERGLRLCQPCQIEARVPWKHRRTLPEAGSPHADAFLIGDVSPYVAGQVDADISKLRWTKNEITSQCWEIGKIGIK